MVVRKALIFFISLLLWGCAQVGQITGGVKDTSAPKPIAELTSPPDSSLHFAGNKISFSFDEFIQLNNPQQTLVIVPNHARLNASLKKKNMQITWEEKLQENTTYVIYMNGTVQDVSEKNDTLLSYVFSTGNTIDSLEYTALVVDAWKNVPLKNITIGLFGATDSLRPYYFSQTGESGWAKFRYLKSGVFRVIAFDDKNKDLHFQANESIGFKSDSLVLSSSISDSLPIRLFQPQRVKKITSAKFFPPASIMLTTSFPMENPAVQLNSKSIGDSLVQFFTKDSLQIFFPKDSIGTCSLLIKADNFSDTVIVRVAEKDKKGTLTIKPFTDLQYTQKGRLMELVVPDIIDTLDKSKFFLFSQKDSVPISFTLIKSKNTFGILPDSLFEGAGILKIYARAIRSTHNLFSDSSVTLFHVRRTDELGSLNVNVGQFEDKPILLELLKGGRTVETKKSIREKMIVFTALPPGEYTCRIIEDENGNGYWDRGNFTENKQPEYVRWFTKPIKVRSNWEVDITLTP